MQTTVYVSNLSANASAFDLESLFEDHGTVFQAHVVANQATGRSKCVGRVIMETEQQAAAAITALNGAVLDGRAMTVSARAGEPIPVSLTDRRPPGRPRGRRPMQGQ